MRPESELAGCQTRTFPSLFQMVYRMPAQTTKHWSSVRHMFKMYTTYQRSVRSGTHAFPQARSAIRKGFPLARDFDNSATTFLSMLYPRVVWKSQCWRYKLGMQVSSETDFCDLQLSSPSRSLIISTKPMLMYICFRRTHPFLHKNSGPLFADRLRRD